MLKSTHDDVSETATIDVRKKGNDITQQPAEYRRLEQRRAFQRHNTIKGVRKRMRVLPKRLVVFISCLVACPESTGFQLSSSRTSTMTNRRIRSSLSVASQDTTETITEEIPYLIARGDGSTGGGGLPMPRSEDESQLKRPKVGAEMPNGRPSWFHVPAPSQGT